MKNYVPPLHPCLWVVRHKTRGTGITLVPCKTAYEACMSLGWQMSECDLFDQVRLVEE